IIETDQDDVDVYVDGDLAGKVTKGSPLTVPGLALGLHEIKAARAGYKPETQQIMVVPGRPATVTMRMRFRVTVKRQAEVLDQEGFKILHSHHSAYNPLMTI